MAAESMQHEQQESGLVTTWRGKSDALMVWARDLEIATDDEYAQAGARKAAIADIVKQIREHYRPRKQQAQAVHRQICADEQAMIEMFEPAKCLCEQKMTAYYVEQERLRREAAEKARREAEERAQAEALRRAEAAEASGDDDAVEAILDEGALPQPAEPVAVAPPPKAAGSAVRKTWIVKSIGDPTAAAVWLAEHHLIENDNAAWKRCVALLNQEARQRGASARVPGVTFGEQTKVGGASR